MEVIMVSWFLICRFQSLKSGEPYEVKFSSKGVLGCNCKAWIFGGRHCKHTNWVEMHLREPSGAIKVGIEIPIL